jgi:hypothetical protein
MPALSLFLAAWTVRPRVVTKSAQTRADLIPSVAVCLHARSRMRWSVSTHVVSRWRRTSRAGCLGSRSSGSSTAPARRRRSGSRAVFARRSWSGRAAGSPSTSRLRRCGRRARSRRTGAGWPSRAAAKPPSVATAGGNPRVLVRGAWGACLVTGFEAGRRPPRPRRSKESAAQHRDRDRGRDDGRARADRRRQLLAGRRQDRRSRGAVFGNVDVYVANADDGSERRVTTTGRARIPSGGRARSPSPASSPTAAGARTRPGACDPTGVGAAC